MTGLASMRTSKFTLVKIFAIATVPVVLFCSGSAASICYQDITQPLIFAFFCLWLVVFLSTNPRLSLFHPASAVLFILIFGVLVSFVASGMEGSSSVITFLSAIFIAYFLVRIFGVKLISNAYIKIIEFLAVVSLLGFCLFEIGGLTPPFPTMQTHTGSTTYSNGIIFCVDLILNSGRNVGIFWEPSIFAAYLNIAFAIILFDRSASRRGLRLLLLLAALLTTESAGGLIELACIVFAFWFKTGNRPFILVSVVALLAIFLMTLPQIQSFLLSVNYDLFYKFFGGSNSGTTLTRIECPLINLQMWLQSPIFGHGFYGADQLYNQIRTGSSLSNLAQTSTITYFLAVMGFSGFALLGAFIYGFAKLTFMPKLSRIALFIAAMVFLNEEPCTYFVAMFLLLFLLIEFVDKKAGFDTSVKDNLIESKGTN